MFGRRKNKNTVTCIGSTSLDIFFPTDEGVVIETPEDILSQRKIAFELGGKILAPELHTAVGGVAANVSQGLSLLGTHTRCYSAVGKDDYGKFCLDALKKNGVDTSIMHILPDARTDISAIIVLLPEGERTIIHNRDANKRLVVHDKDLTTPWVFVSALNGEWQKNIETILHAKKNRGESNFKIAFNPGQHNIKEDGALVLRVVCHTDFLVLNKDEAIELVLYKNPNCAKSLLEDETYLLKTLHQIGAKIVALTDGIRGGWTYDGKELWALPARKILKVVDATGAGDAFTSGFLGALIQEKPIDECLRFGMANGESVIQFYGACAGLHTLTEIEKDILHLIPVKIG